MLVWILQRYYHDIGEVNQTHIFNCIFQVGQWTNGERMGYGRHQSNNQREIRREGVPKWAASQLSTAALFFFLCKTCCSALYSLNVTSGPSWFFEDRYYDTINGKGYKNWLLCSPVEWQSFSFNNIVQHTTQRDTFNLLRYECIILRNKCVN